MPAPNQPSPPHRPTRRSCVGVRLAVKCEGCGGAVPVNGPLPQVKCSRCMEVARLEGRLRWDEILNFQNPSITVFEFAAKSSTGAEERGAWSPVNLNAVAGLPKCPQCGAPHSKEAVRAAVEGGGDLACAGCGTSLPVRTPPDFFRQVFPSVTHVIGADVPDERAPDVTGPGGGRPVVMACMNCRAPLPIDGTTRLVECTFCHARNYLPDDLWLTLHPAPRREFWYLLFTY